jgi:hypothetical protein
MNAQDPEPNAAEKSARLGRTGPPPEEYANPAGVGGDVCEIDDGSPEPEPCDPTEAEDLVLGESRPGYGISGYDGEEVGGG